MTDISREQLHAYLDDALSDSEMARVEQALRESEPLRRALAKPCRSATAANTRSAPSGGASG